MYYLEVVQDPANATFCEGTDATLTCTIFDNSTDRIANDTSWVNYTSGARIISNMHMNTLVSNSRHGNMVNSMLTIVNVSVYANNTEYLCEPKFRIVSSVAVIMIIGEKSTYTCMREHTHTHTHICTTHTHMHAHTHTRTHMHTHTHTYTHNIHTHTCTHMYNTHTHTHIYAHTHIRTCTHMHSHIHTHVCTHAHTRTHM